MLNFGWAKMNSFEEKWLEMINSAKLIAAEQGNETLRDFFELKAANEKIRMDASKTLLEYFFRAIRIKIEEGFKLDVETHGGYKFQMRHALLTGFRVDVLFGLRRLSIEIGWTRLPKDGFMRGGALAYCRITHFGRPEHNSELLLLNSQNPKWFTEKSNSPFDITDAMIHLDRLIQD